MVHIGLIAIVFLKRANRMPCKCVSQLIEHNYIFKKRIGGKRGSHWINHNGNFKKERMQCEEGQGPRLIDRNSIALHFCFFATFYKDGKCVAYNFYYIVSPFQAGGKRVWIKELSLSPVGCGNNSGKLPMATTGIVTPLYPVSIILSQLSCADHYLTQY